MKIGIIITSFLRDKLLYQIVQSILNYTSSDFIIFIGNQSYKTPDDKIIGFSDFCHNFNDKLPINVKYYDLPFDCGLSYARNFLVEKAYEQGCMYILMSADSIQFIENTEKLKDLIQVLAENPVDLIGLNLNKRQSWEKYLSLKSDGFHLYDSQDYIILNNIKFKKCDVVKNFFIAKIKPLLDIKWDETLKLCEHEDWAWRFKENGYKVIWTDYFSANYVNDKPEEYNKYRRRIYNEFKKLLMKKYNITGWLHHG